MKIHNLLEFGIQLGRSIYTISILLRKPNIISKGVKQFDRTTLEKIAIF